MDKFRKYTISAENYNCVGIKDQGRRIANSTNAKADTNSEKVTDDDE